MNGIELSTGAVGRIKINLKFLLAEFSYFVFFKLFIFFWNSLASATLRLYRLDLLLFLAAHR